MYNSDDVREVVSSMKKERADFSKIGVPGVPTRFFSRYLHSICRSRLPSALRKAEAETIPSHPNHTVNSSGLDVGCIEADFVAYVG